jgi:hypothetical protein
MAERKDYQAWWEKVGTGEFLKNLIKHPKIVTRQIGVACDEMMAPAGSDQETFSTLFPSEASKVLNQVISEESRRNYVENLKKGALGGNSEALEELDDIAFGGNEDARQAIREIDGK